MISREDLRQLADFECRLPDEFAISFYFEPRGNGLAGGNGNFQRFIRGGALDKIGSIFIIRLESDK